MTRRATIARLGVPALIAATLGVTVFVPASADTFVKNYSEALRVDSGSAAATAILAPGSTHALHFDITNALSSNQAFGSALILVPAGFTVATTGPSVSGPTNFHVAWNSTHTGFLLTSSGPTGSGVKPGKSITVSASVTAPTTPACALSWLTDVKQSNNFSGTGNDFVGNSVTTSVGNNHLVFTAQPTDTEFDKTMAQVLVTAEDPCNNTVTDFNGTVTLADAFTPTKVSGGSTTMAASGVATFGGITFVSNDWGYQDSFTAGATGFDSATSDTFNVDELNTTCVASKTCSTAPLSNPGTVNTTATININSAPTADALKVSVAGDPNTQAFVQTCAGSVPTGTATPRFYGSVVSLLVNNRQKTVTMVLPKSYVLLQPTPNGTPFWDICLQSDVGFTDKFGHTGVTAGFLPDCPSVLPSPVAPCVLSRNKNAGDEIMKFVLPPGDPHFAWG